MKAIIDLVLLGILVMCAWNGYKKGLIMGVGGILCIIIAIYGANLLANTFSHDIMPALKPFAIGYTENLISGNDSPVMERMGWEDSEYSVEDLLDAHPEQREQFCAECFKELGVGEKSSAILAERAVTYARETDSTVWNSVGHILCETASYVGCFVLAFLMIIIILTVLGNLPNLSFKLPNLDLFNDIAGLLLGIVTGLMYCVILVWVLKFLGKLIGSDTLASTGLGRLLLEKDFLLKYLGI